MADSKTTAGRKRPPSVVAVTTTTLTPTTTTATTPSTSTNTTNKKYQSQRTALQEMGFEMHDISTALDTTSGDLDAAMAILLGEPVNGGATRILPPMKLVVTGKTTTSVKVAQNKIIDMREIHNKFMAVYKVQKCKEKGNHDKRLCFGFHTAGDRRRNPFDVLVPYICTECATPPTETTNCPDGDGCLKSHNMLERMFHPELFKISMCQRGPNGSLCERGNLCAFAHSDEDMRLPLSHTMGKQTPPSPALSPMAMPTNATGLNKETTTFLADGSKSMDNNRISKHGYGDDKLSGMNEVLPPAVVGGVHGTKTVTSWAHAVASSSQPPATSIANTNTTVSNPNNDMGNSAADGIGGRSRRRGPSGPLSNLSLETDGPGSGPGSNISVPAPSSVSLLRSASNESNGVVKPYYPSESIFGDVGGMDLRASQENSPFGMVNSVSPTSPVQSGLANYVPGMLPSSSPERNNMNVNNNGVASSPSGLRRRGPPIDFLDLSSSSMNNNKLAVGGGMAITIPGTPGVGGPAGQGILNQSTSMAELSEKFQQVTQMQQLYLSQMNNLQNELGVKSRECVDLKRLKLESDETNEAIIQSIRAELLATQQLLRQREQDILNTQEMLDGALTQSNSRLPELHSTRAKLNVVESDYEKSRIQNMELDRSRSLLIAEVDSLRSQLGGGPLGLQLQQTSAALAQSNRDRDDLADIVTKMTQQQQQQQQHRVPQQPPPSGSGYLNQQQPNSNVSSFSGLASGIDSGNGGNGLSTRSVTATKPGGNNVFMNSGGGSNNTGGVGGFGRDNAMDHGNNNNNNSYHHQPNGNNNNNNNNNNNTMNSNSFSGGQGQGLGGNVMHSTGMMMHQQQQQQQQQPLSHHQQQQQQQQTMIPCALSGCNQPGLYMCACQNVRYCSDTCQKSHWHTHMPDCTSIRKWP